MSDSVRRFRAISQALHSMYPEKPVGNLKRHLYTLSSMIAGIVANKKVHLSQIAQAHTDTTRVESRIMKYCRFTQNESVDMTRYFLPYIKELLSGLEQRALVLAIDTSAVGRNCLCLMISLIYKNRAIPLIWSVTDQKKGHLSQDIHLSLLEDLKELLPDDLAITLVGDGEFDGTQLINRLRGYNVHYVLRSAKDALLMIDKTWKRFDELIPCEGADYTMVHGAFFTKEALIGPMQAICYWDRRFKDPLLLLTDYTSVDQAIACYRKRAKIETLFSDQKSRGFNIHKSHMDDPKRLHRLLIAASLAYIWIIYLGDLADTKGLRGLLERRDRADLSLFQLGLHMLAHLLNHDLPVIVDFQLNVTPSHQIPLCVG